jgi:plastocyanin
MPAGRRLILFSAVLVLAGGAAACSNREATINKNPHTGAGTASPVDGTNQITVKAGSDYRFHPSRITVGPGRLRVVLVNTEKAGQGAPHNLQVVGQPSAAVPLAAAGTTQTVTFTAPAPGTYRFVCSIHVAQGQTGTLIVKGH